MKDLHAKTLRILIHLVYNKALKRKCREDPYSVFTCTVHIPLKTERKISISIHGIFWTAYIYRYPVKQTSQLLLSKAKAFTM